jgi:hypothetical protein
MNKAVKIALKITEKKKYKYQYVYDPNHNDKPAGSDWKMTKSGWSRKVADPANKPILEHDNPVINKEESSKTVQKQETTTVQDTSGQKLNLDQSSVPVDTSKAEDAPAEGEDLFSKGEEFVTDEKGKEEEQQETEQQGEGEGETQAPEDSGKLTLDEGEEDFFDEQHGADYLNPDMYDQFIERMNSFIHEFDEGEGKENEVTFKAIASNLNWASLDDVKAFQKHCQDKGINGSGEVIGFLYYQHKENEDKFDQIITDMP